MNEIRNHWKKWIYWFFLGVAIIIVYKTLDNFTNIMDTLKKFFSIISPFFAGILIAYILYIPARGIEKVYKKNKIKFIRRRARGLSVLTTYIIAIIVIMIISNVILPVILESVADLVKNIPSYYQTVINQYNNLPDDSEIKNEISNEIINFAQNIDIKQYFELDKIIKYAMGALSAVTSVFEIFVAIIVSIYVLLERTQILKFLQKVVRAVFKETTCKNIDKYFNNSNEIFVKFITSQLVDALIVGILVTIALSIMGVKYAPLLGFFIGLFNMIPYFGAIIAVGISVIITAITGGLTQAIWMLIIVIILQQIDANIINPKIVGKSLKISPLLVIFAVTIGGAYFGILGMFLAVPIIAVIKILVEDYIDIKIKQKDNCAIREDENINESKIN